MARPATTDGPRSGKLKSKTHTYTHPPERSQRHHQHHHTPYTTTPTTPHHHQHHHTPKTVGGTPHHTTPYPPQPETGSGGRWRRPMSGGMGSKSSPYLRAEPEDTVPSREGGGRRRETDLESQSPVAKTAPPTTMGSPGGDIPSTRRERNMR